MRTLIEQWIEDGRMYKAVRQIGALIEKKDLGPVNEEGLPLCPFCKGCPELESEENWEGRDIWFVECDVCGARTAEYLEDAEAVDAWKRRA